MIKSAERMGKERKDENENEAKRNYSMLWNNQKEYIREYWD